ncbi:MAG TPA: type II secretion system protein [Kofleriaceae bacterium]|nr:type II secretion system protein [Kofleriaceae bacterium]
MRERRQEGITLIELMVVIAIVGVLASLAIFAFTRQTRKAQAQSEISSMFAKIKSAQEAFHLENGTYLQTGATETDFFPSASPPAGGTQAFDIADSPAPPSPLDARFPGPSWETLRIRPDKSELHCVYVVIAGEGGEAGNVGSIAAGEPFNLGSTDRPVPAVDWYYVLAECDFDGDGTPSRYFTLSDSEETVVQNRGE